MKLLDLPFYFLSPPKFIVLAAILVMNYEQRTWVMKRKHH